MSHTSRVLESFREIHLIDILNIDSIWVLKCCSEAQASLSPEVGAAASCYTNNVQTSEFVCRPVGAYLIKTPRPEMNFPVPCFCC